MTDENRDDRAVDPARTSDRFDVAIEWHEFDSTTGAYEVSLRPDPKRYEWRTRGATRVLYDRLDNVQFAEPVVKKLFEQAVAHFPPQPLPILGDIGRYVSERRPQIDSALLGTEDKDGGHTVDRSQEYLASRAADELAFAILSIDVVNSSRLSSRLGPSELGKVLGAYLTEVSSLVAFFYGHVLRYEGDGLVAYFPSPAFITTNDLAVDCAVCIRQLVYEGLNPALQAAGFEPLDIRIGLDSGTAAVTVLGSPQTKRHADLVGDVIALACNIQAQASPGEILIGDTVEHNLHVDWRTRCAPVEVPSGWDYRVVCSDIYGIHRVDTSRQRPIEARATTD